MTLLCSASFLYGTLFYAKYIAISESVAATHLGLIGTFLSIVMTASPLVTVVCNCFSSPFHYPPVVVNESEQFFNISKSA